ncbi:alpha/beta hydrolase [Amycolatopsis sp. NPDC004079]|uniref:alpha/beta fold hydrolase n=1 Tax=Amycolatopsis sp. NPDC004079 TaxID=3154549 RepID=UPI0033A1CA8A
MAFSVTPGRLPAIVLDAGGGMDSSEWGTVAPDLAARTGSEIIAYDRSGEGKSDESPGPWRADNAAADLAAGLMRLGVTKNVVLVSHSLAGEVAFSFARSHPDRVAGAVLVDANLPQFFTPSETAKLVALNEKQVEDLKKAPSTRQTRQLLAQADGYGPVHEAYHKLTWPSGIPVAVIVSAETPFPTPEDAQLWRQAQQDFAHAAPNRTLVTAEHSSHDVPLDRPDVVGTAVENLLKQVR